MKKLFHTDISTVCINIFNVAWKYDNIYVQMISCVSVFNSTKLSKLSTNSKVQMIRKRLEKQQNFNHCLNPNYTVQ